MNPNIQQFELRLPRELHKALKRAAFEANQSMNKFICEAINKAIPERPFSNNDKPPKLFFPDGF